MEYAQLDLNRVNFLKNGKALAIVEVPAVRGKVQLRVQGNGGSFLPLFEWPTIDEYSFKEYVRPLLLKLN